ncbi:MAG: DUF1574 family protein [Gemmataceae bacterium]
MTLHKGTVLTLSRPRRKERFARAVLIWGLLWYAVFNLFPLLIQDRTTEFPWHTIGAAMEARKLPKLRQLAAEDGDRPLVLMMGSSRVCWAFRAGDLDGMPDSDGRPLRVYNYGIPATGPIYELLAVRRLLAEGIRPRLLLIEFLPTLMCKHHHGALNEENLMVVESIGARRLLQWLPYLHRPATSAGLWLGSRVYPWYAFRHQIRLQATCLVNRRSCPTYGPIDESGWHIPFATDWPIFEQWSRLAIERVNYYPAISRFRLAKEPTRALHELLDLCRRERIPTALVIMPESSQFRGWYSYGSKKPLRGLLDELRRTYGVEVIDANRWLGDWDFEDGQHAVLHGVKVFTSRLRAELPRLLARSQTAKSN